MLAAGLLCSVPRRGVGMKNWEDYKNESCLSA